MIVSGAIGRTLLGDIAKAAEDEMRASTSSLAFSPEKTETPRKPTSWVHPLFVSKSKDLLLSERLL